MDSSLADAHVPSFDLRQHVGLDGWYESVTFLFLDRLLLPVREATACWFLRTQVLVDWFRALPAYLLLPVRRHRIESFLFAEFFPEGDSSVCQIYRRTAGSVSRAAGLELDQEVLPDLLPASQADRQFFPSQASSTSGQALEWSLPWGRSLRDELYFMFGCHDRSVQSP